MPGGPDPCVAAAQLEISPPFQGGFSVDIRIDRHRSKSAVMCLFFLFSLILVLGNEMK